MAREVKVIGLEIPRINVGDDIADAILKSVQNKGGLKEKDIIVVSSSVVATAQGRTRKFKDVKPSEQAHKLAKKANLGQKLAEIILEESDEILGIGNECILTAKNGALRSNAGVDQSNVPIGEVLLLPENPKKAAKEIRTKIQEKTGSRIGIIIADSFVRPLRFGTVGLAIGVSGIDPIMDCRGKRDLFGRSLKITFRAIADQLATAAQIVMGEADEGIPAAVVRGADVPFFVESNEKMKISEKDDIYSDFLNQLTKIYSSKNSNL